MEQIGLDNAMIIRILTKHCITYYVDAEDKVEAYDNVVCVHEGSRITFTSTWVDVTGWTATRLYAWLGY